MIVRIPEKRRKGKSRVESEKKRMNTG